MTDILTPPAEVEPPAPADDKQPCEVCGEPFTTGPGMARHMAKVHPEVRMKTQDTECPECGKWLTNGSLVRHRRKVHGIYARRSRGPGRPPGSKNMPAKTPATVRTHVDRNTSPLTADQITTAAAISLFPAGVPTRKLQVLLRWHESTLTFLREVQDE